MSKLFGRKVLKWAYTYCEKPYEKCLQVKRNIRYLDMNVQGKKGKNKKSE